MLYGKRKLQLNEAEREKARAAGHFNGQLMDFIREHIQPGITTGEIDRLVREYTHGHGHRCAPQNYQGFPKSCCTSINEVVCHGIPGKYALRPGDIVNIDVTSIVNGWHGDSSETFLIGDVSDESRLVTQCAFDALHAAIRALRPNCRISVIGDAVIREAAKYGFGVVEEYVGHGVGRRFHQDPTIPHTPTRQARLERIPPGVCFTVEPMINAGTKQTVADKSDGWTVRTKDLRVSAQFEHTVLMTETGPEILTPTKTGPQPGHRF